MSAVVKRARRRLDQAIRDGGESWFRLRYGPETSGFWYPDDGRTTDENVWYDPTAWLGLRRALRRLRPTASDVFVDIGSGKGRAVLVAATMPFGRVEGVELAPELTTIAERAIDRNSNRVRAGGVKLVTSDALEYQIADDTTVVYLYSPFVGDLFRAFLGRFLAFVDRVGRPVRLVYNYPFEHPYVISTDRFDVVDVVSSAWPSNDLSSADVIVTYVARPSSQLAETPGHAPLPRGAERWRGPYDPGFVLVRPGGEVVRSSEAWAPED